MGRAYAGRLGLVAFALMAIRGVLAAASAQQTLLAASAALFAFAALGYVLGNLAEHLVRESVRNQFQAAMAAWEQHPPETKPQK
jgi:hypothetical protein